MSYVDGFVVAVPSDNKEIYRRHAEVIKLSSRLYGTETLIS